MGHGDSWWKTKVAKPEDALFTGACEGDVIVPVMGPTGAGKSTFINNYLDKNVARVGHDLESCTTALEPFIVDYLQDEHRRLILVDTPGFDDTNQADSVILRRIAVWLASSYGPGKTCGGIIYLHDITDARMRGTTLQNLKVFQSLCGKKNYEFVVFGITKSGGLTPEVFARREKELKEVYWKECMKKKARVFKLLPSHASAKELIDIVLERVEKEQHILLIQKELVKLQKIIPTTKAGQELKYSLDEIMAHHKEVLAGGTVSEEDAAAVKAKIAVVGEQLKGLKLSLTQRISVFFG